MNDIWEMF